MQTNVAQLLKAPLGSIRTFEVNSILEEGPNQYVVKGDVTLIRTNRSILAQGTLTAQTKIMCSRCLKQFNCNLKLDIEEEYFPTIDIITGSRLPEPEEPGSFTIDEHHELDLTEAVRQYVITTLPMKPLCKEACAGLCSVCGKDLNTDECDCKMEETDPRWSELLKLKNSNKVKITNSNKGRSKDGTTT